MVSISTQPFHDFVCVNFKDKSLEGGLSIGYAHNPWPFILLPSFALALNLFIIVTHIRKQCDARKLKKSMGGESSSIEKMLYYLTLVETLISVYWLCNGTIFYDVEKISTNCGFCFISSIISIFIQCFDWIFFTCSLHNILLFVQDPLKEQTFQFRLKMYFIISAAIAGIFTYSVFLAGIYGISPMLTCFIRNKFENNDKLVSIYGILIAPIFYLVYSIYTFVKIFRHRQVKADSELKIAVVKYLIYSLLYIVFYFPSIVLLIITINDDLVEGGWLRWFSYFCCIANVSVNLVLCLYRIGEGYVKCHWKAFFVNADLHESFVTESSRESISINDQNVIDFINKPDEVPVQDLNKLKKKRSSVKTGKSLLIKRMSSWKKISVEIFQGYLRNFFIGLILCLENSKNIKVEKVMKSKYFTCTENPYIFKNNRDINRTSNKVAVAAVENINVSNEVSMSESNISIIQEYLEEGTYIEVVEYAPKVFKKIRFNEGIGEEEIIESLNPINNLSIIKSQGKSSSFFMATDDSKLIIKTLKKEEFDNIFNKFLIFYHQYIESYPDSLICRIYGIYSVKASTDAEPVHIVIMRDARGPLKKFIKKTYDLKGSLHKRETIINDDNNNNPYLARKDLNFLKEEKFLKIENKKLFVNIATCDAEFFEDLNLMDYSLLLLKLEFDEDMYTEFLNFKKTKDYTYYERHIYFSTENPRIAFLVVIIDYLQDFSFFKLMENNIKNFITERPSDANMISCVPSDIYSKRFVEFIQKITDFHS